MSNFSISVADILRLVTVQCMTHLTVEMSGSIFHLYEPSVTQTRVLFSSPSVIQLGFSGMTNPFSIQALPQLHENSMNV